MMLVAAALAFAVAVVLLTTGFVLGDGVDDVWNVKRWPNPQSPYPVQIVDDPFAQCHSKKGTLDHLLNDGATWRVVLSADENPNYLAFWPSVSEMWKKFGAVPVLALVSVKEKMDIEVLPLLETYGEVVVLKAVDDPSVPLGHQAKLARSFVASRYLDDVVTVGDLDHYVFHPDWIKQAVLRCGQPHQLVGVGWNLYWDYVVRTKERALRGKYPMYFSTGRGRTFASFLNPANHSFPEFIAELKGLAVFEKNENPFQSYGGDHGFSDESVFRSLLYKTFGHQKRPHVVWVTKKNTKRIDRASRADIRGLSQAAMQPYFDVFPNRPLHDCTTYVQRLLPVHRYLKIANPDREANFLQACKNAGLKSKDWTCVGCNSKESGSTLEQSAIDCIKNAK